MNNLKKLIVERFKASSKKSKDKKFIKDQINLIKKTTDVHYKEVRSYYKSHKNDKSDKIVRRYKKLMGDRSLTEYFDYYYKNINKDINEYIDKYIQEAIKKNPDFRNEDMDMDTVFKEVIRNVSDTICGEFTIMYRKIFRDQSILLKKFSTDSKAIYKKMKEVYDGAKSEVDKAYDSCKNKFKSVVEEHIIGEIESIKPVECQNLAKLIVGGVNLKYAKGDLETSIRDKYYLVNMKAEDGEGREGIISNSQSQYNAETLKTDINLAIKNLLILKNKAKYVTEEDIKECKKAFNGDVSLLERCIAGMKKFAAELPKMVDKCAEIIESNKKKEMNNQSGSNASNRPNNRSRSNASKRPNNRSRSNASKRPNNRSGRRNVNKPKSRNKR